MAAAECTAGGSSPGGTGLRLKRAGFLTWFRTSGIKGALEMVNAERLSPWLGSAGPNRYGASGNRYGDRYTEIGRAHVRTPVTNAHLVCRLLLEKKTQLCNMIKSQLSIQVIH